MKRRTRGLVGGGLLALLFLLGIGLWVLLGEPFRQERRLPDDSVVTLEGTSYGTQHAFDGRKWWEKAFPGLRSLWFADWWQKTFPRLPVPRSPSPAFGSWAR